ncbi:MAG: ribonuclease P protein component [Gammaproteobacteria bacterium]
MICSLTRGVRITKASDYAHIFQKGKRTQGKFWQLVAAPSNESTPRLGLAISKKVYKRAVDRNLRKRLAREMFRLQQTQLNNLDMVVMAKKSRHADNKSLMDDLSSLFRKASEA